jgi:hypothetical protein
LQLLAMGAWNLKPRRRYWHGLRTALMSQDIFQYVCKRSSNLEGYGGRSSCFDNKRREISCSTSYAGQDNVSHTLALGEPELNSKCAVFSKRYKHLWWSNVYLDRVSFPFRRDIGMTRRGESLDALVALPFCRVENFLVMVVEMIEAKEIVLTMPFKIRCVHLISYCKGFHVC